MKKYIFVVGGVLSGVGKGVTSASLGAMFKDKGFSVTALKADPYINVDAGTMNPTEHGEVFVTVDGDETDQDMGNYERFLDVDLTSKNYMTTGRVYLSVIEKERSMHYKGKCVQVVPHIPEEIISRIENAADHHDAEIVIIEIGGTVGEYENLLFLEAARMMKLKYPKDVAFVLVSYLPVPSHIGEMKTKPTQHASRQLNGVGINADILVARSYQPLDEPRKEKLAIFCGLPKERIITAPDVSSIYEIPLEMDKQHICELLLESLHVEERKSDIPTWKSLISRINAVQGEVSIAVVGKYFGTGDYTLSDSYISVIEALKHACWHLGVAPNLTWIDSETYEENPDAVKELAQFDGVLVPGGFGTRGVEGIINAITFVRERNIPYFGICYGMQLASIEFVRNVVGKKEANTEEMDEQTSEPVIHTNKEQLSHISDNKYGGTMRLGSYSATLSEGSKVRELYKDTEISERHRHRYEFNNAYRKDLEDSGMKIVGVNKEKDLVEIIELDQHPYFIACQFHPEFQSRPNRPHPLFVGFIEASKKAPKGA